MRHGISVRGRRSEKQGAVLASDVSEQWFWDYDLKHNKFVKDTPAARVFTFLKDQYDRDGSVLSDAVLVEAVESADLDATDKADLVSFVGEMRSEKHHAGQL